MLEQAILMVYCNIIAPAGSQQCVVIISCDNGRDIPDIGYEEGSSSGDGAGGDDDEDDIPSFLSLFGVSLLLCYTFFCTHVHKLKPAAALECFTNHNYTFLYSYLAIRNFTCKDFHSCLVRSH